MRFVDGVKLYVSAMLLTITLGLAWAAHGPLPPPTKPMEPDPEIIWVFTPEPTEFTGWGYYYPTPTPPPTPTPKEITYGYAWPQDDYEEFEADRARFFCHYPLEAVEKGVRRDSTKSISMPRTLAMHLRQHELDYVLSNGDHDCDEAPEEEDPW